MPAPTLTTDRIRLKIDVAKKAAALDILRAGAASEGSTPRLWHSSDCRLEIGVFYNGLLTDTTGWTTLTVQIKAANGNTAPASDTAPLASASTASFDATAVDATWLDGTKQHAVVDFSAAVMNFTRSTTGHWLVVMLTLGSGKILTLSAGPCDVMEDGYTPGGVPPTPEGFSYTQSEADARFAAYAETPVTGNITAVTGKRYVTSLVGTATIADPVGVVDGVYYVRIGVGSAIIGGVTYSGSSTQEAVITRYYGLSGWTTRNSYTVVETISTDLGTLTSTVAANALIAANANGAVSREWYTCWLGNNSWPEIAYPTHVSGGSSNSTTVAGTGSVLPVSCGTTATGGARGCLNSFVNIEFGVLWSWKLMGGLRRGSASVYDAVTNTGHVIFGFHNNGSIQDAVHGCYFRSTDGGNWMAVSTTNSTPTTTDTGIPFDTTLRNFEIDINLAGTSAIYKINGTTVASHGTSFIPKGSGCAVCFMIKSQKIAATANAVILQCNFALLRSTSASALFTN